MKKRGLQRWAPFVSLLMAAVAAVAQAQQAPVTLPMSSQPVPPSANAPQRPAKPVKERDRRRAVKIYLASARLYEAQQFEQALAGYEQAAALDPNNNDYALAVEVARSHAVSALLQKAAQSRTRGDGAAARAALQRAVQLDPLNQALAERLQQAAEDGPLPDREPPPLSPTPALGGFEHLAPLPGTHSFHVKSSQRQVIQQVFKAWGLDATIDDSIRGNLARLDVDDVSFEEAMRALSVLTKSFYVAIDPHRALVALDTRELRQQYMRNGVETVPLSGLSANEMTDMGNMARNVFGFQQAAVDATAATLTLRGPEQALTAFNSTYRDLSEGRSQVLIEVKVLQMAHLNGRKTGALPQQKITAFDVFAEEQAILKQNQDLVNQIIEQGLAAPGDTLTILGILLASGQVSSSLFQNGLLLFGGGISQSALVPGSATLNFSLNSSDSRELDEYRLRLQDGEEGTLKSGTRYPIQTASYSSLGASSSTLSGLTSAGTSSNLSALLSSVTSSTNIPQFQYQDLGLVLKATPRVLRSGNVALNVDMKISALAGTSLNSVPVLANRAYSGVSTLRANEAIVIASELDENESRAVSGYPGITDIPGLNNVTQKETQKNRSTLLVIMTARVVRNPHGLGHTNMVHIERNLSR